MNKSEMLTIADALVTQARENHSRGRLSSDNLARIEGRHWHLSQTTYRVGGVRKSSLTKPSIERVVSGLVKLIEDDYVATAKAVAA